MFGAMIKMEGSASLFSPMTDPHFLPSSAFNNLSAWRLFLRVCDLRSLSGAAKSTGLDVSTISRRLDQLEADIGTKLVHRTTRSIVVTPVGEKVRRRIVKVLSELDDTVTEIVNPGIAQEDVVSLSAPPCFIEYVLNGWALEYAAEHPGVCFDFHLNDQRVDPLNAGIDIAVHSGAAVALDRNMVRLGALSSVMVAAPAYLERYGTPTYPQDLFNGHILLGYSGSMASKSTWLCKDGKLQKFCYAPALRTSSTVGLIRVALAGKGVLLYGPHFMIGDALRSGALVEILSDWKQPDTIVHAVISPASRHRPAVAGFLEFMKNRWASHPGFFADPRTFEETATGYPEVKVQAP